METLNEIIDRAVESCDQFHPITIYNVNCDVWGKKYILGHKLKKTIGRPIMEISKDFHGKVIQKIIN